MKAQYQNSDAITARWNYPPNCRGPVFPVIYLECLKAAECRGFLRLKHLIGDIDFVGYPLQGGEILIDSSGRVMDLAFDDFLYPNSVIATWSEKELKENIGPALKYSGNAELESRVLNEENVGVIVERMAEFFAW